MTRSAAPAVGPRAALGAIRGPTLRPTRESPVRAAARAAWQSTALAPRNRAAALARGVVDAGVVVRAIAAVVTTLRIAVVAVLGIVAVAAAGDQTAGERFGLGFGSLLGARAARDIAGLALGAPSPAGDRAVVEADQVAQRVELLLIELAGITDPQVVKREGRKRDALELVDLVAERLDHAVDLAVLALVDRDAEPGVLALAGQDLDLGWHGGGAVVKHDALAQRIDLAAIELAVDLDVVGLGHVAAWREQAGGQLAIVGEQQHAFGIEVEPTDRLDRHGQVRQVVHHRRASAIVGHGCDAGLGLIEQDIEVVERDGGLAIDQHIVLVGIDLGAEHGHDLAVDLDAARDDQLLGLAARGDTSGGEVPL